MPWTRPRKLSPREVGAFRSHVQTIMTGHTAKRIHLGDDLVEPERDRARVIAAALKLHAQELNAAIRRLGRITSDEVFALIDKLEGT